MSTAHAMILAAGRGERMRPLTDTTPKPLLQVRGQSLIARHVRALAAQGFTDLVVNTAWLGEQVPPHLALLDGELGLALAYSHEGQDFGRALETAGGILRALPLLGEVFWVAAGDVFVPDFAFARETFERFAASDALAHLWLVPNPAHNPGGDFGLQAGRVLNLPAGHAQRRWTFSTIALYRRSFFTGAPAPAGNPQGLALALAPLLRAAMDRGEVSGEVYTGAWTDVGTPERLAELNR
jgi:MurNAc alpha-1-phosphate uridylyltransferase